jgi:hypothetical protein
LILILFIAAIVLAPRALVAFAQHPWPPVLQQYTLFFYIISFFLVCAFAVPTMRKNMFNYTADPEPDRVLARVLGRLCGNKLSVQLLESYTPKKFENLLRSDPRVRFGIQQSESEERIRIRAQ